jgi:hypothetical protein
MRYIYNSYYIISPSRIEDNDAFKHYLEFTVMDDGSFEFPICLFTKIDSLLKGNAGGLLFKDNSKVVIPIIEGRSVREHSYQKAFELMMNQPLYSGYLKVTCVPNNKVYYGYRGLILNDEFVPIFNIKVKVNYDDVNNRYFLAKDSITLYIDSSVIDNSSKELNNMIVKKAIPYYLHNTVYFGNISHAFYDYHSVRVIIENMKPLASTLNHEEKVNNEIINETLEKETDNIINFVS